MITIRPATVEDVPTMMRFVVELARYEKAEHEVMATESDLREGLFGADSRVEAAICEFEDEPIGHAVFFMNFSTWLGKYGIFLEELYITPEKRGIGAGKALLEHVAGIAVSRGCGRFEWNVLDWNETAIRFYEALGAEALSEWVGYRVAGPALARLGGAGASP
ncbi:MAG: GNAT family N-acetyltransferase [Halieaceae bacterium]|nr:GNAT family N-acetyltransferase [Halieaceae bacterium]